MAKRTLNYAVQAGSRKYEVETADGRKVLVTVPEPAAICVGDLEAALKDNMSPAAIATIVAYIQPVRVDIPEVEREVLWFSEMLIGLLGGPDAFNRLIDDVGL